MARANILGQGRKPASQIGAPRQITQPPKQLITTKPPTA